MATYSAEEQNTNITTATTTTIFTALAGANDQARVKRCMLSIRNKGTEDNTITLRKSSGGTFELAEFTLSAGQDWTNERWDITIAGTATTLEVVTSSTSAIDVVCGFIKKVA